MKIQPIRSPEQWWEFAEREEQRQKEAIEAFVRRERQLHPKVVTGHQMAVFFGWCCAIAAGAILLDRLWVWGCIWFWSNR